MNEHFRESNNREIPTHDPQTGELNPLYEELTGKTNPLRFYPKKTLLDRFKNLFKKP